MLILWRSLLYCLLHFKNETWDSHPVPSCLAISTSSYYIHRMMMQIFHFCTLSSSNVFFSFHHSFMDGCSSFWLLLLNDVCWHHKIWGITSLLWHSMMHYWLLRYFFLRLWFFWFSFLLLPSHFIAFQTLLHTQTHILWLSLLII